MSSFNCDHCGSLATAPFLICDGTKFACAGRARDADFNSKRLDEVRHGVTVEHRTLIRHEKTWHYLLHFCGTMILRVLVYWYVRLL